MSEEVIESGIATRAAGALAQLPTSDPVATMLQTAIERGATPEALEKLVSLYERMQANTARQHFADAIAAFRAACPPIPRRTANRFFKKINRDGVEGPHMYASLEDIAATIKEPLADHGLSYRWGDAIPGDKVIVVPCIVSHRDGHSESASVPMSLESRAGCSDQQKYGIAFTYAQRYSLIAALGLTSCEEDNDSNPGQNDEPITESQVANLQAMIDEVGAKKDGFLRFMGVKALGEIPSNRFKDAIAALDEKRRAKR